MATIQTAYLGELRTQSKHLQSGELIITDAPIDNNGKGQAFSPTDTVAGALASCMMTIMGILAEREGIDLSGLKADVTKIMSATPPRKIQEIIISFHWPTPPATEVQIEKLKRAARTCPVALSLHPEVKQTLHFDF